MGLFSLKTSLRIGRSLITKDSPIYVQYYITARCNLACEQCNVIYSNADVQEANLSEVEKIAENLAKIGVSVILLTGGEPFVRKDLPEIVRAFSSRGMHVRLQTNGLASKESLIACVEAGANDISVSLDSLVPDVQDAINGNVANSWQKAIRTVSLVNEVFPDDSLAVFGCVLAPRNLKQIPDVIRFATEVGWWVSLVSAHVTNKHLPLSFRTYDTSLIFPKSQWAEVDSVLDEAKRMRDAGFSVYDSDPYLEDMKRMIRGEPVQWRDRNKGVCDSPNLYFAVIPNGDMAVCCDWRLKSRVSIISSEFPEVYRTRSLQNEAKAIAAGCPGCLFGSFPEITISSRYLEPMLSRIASLGFSSPSRQRKKLSVEEMLTIAEKIRSTPAKPLREASELARVNP